MHLKEYLRPGDASRIADKLGVSFVTVYRWSNGDAVPGRRLMRRLSEITNGAVTANDFYDLQPDQRRQKKAG
jgi:hypothetical protein